MRDREVETFMSNILSRHLCGDKGVMEWWKVERGTYSSGTTTASTSTTTKLPWKRIQTPRTIVLLVSRMEMQGRL